MGTGYTGLIRIYCSGIGGIGLSAYAAFQGASGHTVSGSDRTESPVISDLRSQGIAVTLRQDGSAIPEDTELFVYSEAMAEGSPERRRAAELQTRRQTYFQALGEISRGNRVIAVCGTHGKSSTTAMAARMLLLLRKDPSVIVGTKLRELQGRNWRKGWSELFLLEACEYRRSFLSLSPSIVLLTNADGDHFDYYRSLPDYLQAFGEFLARLPENGTVITHGDDPACRRLAEESGRRWIDADAIPLPDLSIPGEHMRQNARLVVALGDALRLDRAAVLAALRGYAGCWRRMEKKGEYRGIPVIDDYGHHPTEIRATIAGIREGYPGRRLVTVFQAHTHNRTLALYEDFTKAFTGSAVVVVPPIYDARRETETGEVDQEQFAKDIAQGSETFASTAKSLEDARERLTGGILQDGDILLCIGAGDITSLASSMIEES